MHLSTCPALHSSFPGLFTPTLYFEPREASINSVHNAIYGGIATCHDIVSAFISRIVTYNPQINVIITLNPNALIMADELDAQYQAGNVLGPLFCVPVLVKDNFDTYDMKTTGGCLALADLQPTKDSAVISAFRRAGAIILGKTNLHELALEGISVSSLGGQSINPYAKSRTPGGSSGGSGAAIASSFSVLATCTDTVNSCRNPSSANSVVSIRSTRGLLSRTGVIPVSYTQDVVGPMGHSVRDVAIALTVMAGIGYDPMDNTTSAIPEGSKNVDYASALGSGVLGLKSIRLGVLEGFFNRTDSPETNPVNSVMNTVLNKLKMAGSTLVSLNDSFFNADTISSLWDVQRFEFREALDGYLNAAVMNGNNNIPRSFEELYSGNRFLVLPNQYEYIRSSLKWSTRNSSYAERKLAIETLLKVRLNILFQVHRLDAIIYPEQRNLVVKIGSPTQHGRNGILAALTSMPAIALPAGFSEAMDDAPLGIPIGMEILGQAWSEAKILRIANMIETLLRARKSPILDEPTKINPGTFGTVPPIIPNTSNLPPVYLVGTLDRANRKSNPYKFCAEPELDSTVNK